jgi:CRISPR-associated RAMP protein (TIGR02581 family)
MQDMTSLQNRFRVTGTLTTRSGMRIGAGRSANLIGSDLPLVLDTQSRPYIPGSSLKGVFRTQAEQMVNAFISSATDPAGVMETDKQIRTSGSFQGLGDEQKFHHIINNSNEIVKLFGSTLIAGRIFFRDAMIIENSFSYVETRNGVQIDRDTGSQKKGALYDYDTVPAGVRFSFELLIENTSDIQVGLVVLILDSWKANGFQVGGFTRRGLGWMALSDYEESFNEISKPHDLIDLLQGTHKPLDELKRKQSITALIDHLTSSAGV